MKVTGYRVGSRMKVEIIGSAAEFSDFIQALTYDTKTEEVDTAKETAKKIREIYDRYFRDCDEGKG